ncbi:related to protein RPF2 involved in ribosomal large subunit assembly and maintenance [Sporisorium reilianum SRZ2]|uniref:Ribosome production factor 2 homolog n=1 Tax=Sporisorium reilianum (strain SRZ2) TaxID=999809 RepID=E6ZK42_SPORE|nr:related to protein RPF2 involved in ribosomal large subunit assembly and maintenance [Sporisorium reilianum SRZ2]
MIRVAKPKNARSKRALEKRQAREYEAAKTAIFVKGPHSSARLNIALTELNLLKKPDSISFNKKNEALPFEDTSSFEFWSGKNDASLFVFGNSQKKRPDNLTWIRMFDGQVLDMVEMGVVGAKSMGEFKGVARPGVGMRPLFHFSGPQFTTPVDATTSMVAGAEGTEHDPTGAYQQFKSMLLDFYRGEELQTNQIALSGLQHVISVTAAPAAEQSQPNGHAAGAPGDTLADLYKAAGLAPNGTVVTPSSSSTVTSPSGTLVHFRVYTVQLLASGSKTPRVELHECGPAFDFQLRRRRPASIDMLNQALRRPKTHAEKNRQGKEGAKKNVETDDMGDTVGRIHVGKQDLGGLQTRKMKGLKKHLDPTGSDEDEDGEGVSGDEEDEELEMDDMTMYNNEDDEDEDEDEDEEDEEEDEAPSKRRRS